MTSGPPTREELQRRYVAVRETLRRVQDFLTRFSFVLDTPLSPITFRLSARLDFTDVQIDEFSAQPASLTVELLMRMRQGQVYNGQICETPPLSYGVSQRFAICELAAASNMEAALRPRIKQMYWTAWKSLFDQSYKEKDGPMP